MGRTLLYPGRLVVNFVRIMDNPLPFFPEAVTPWRRDDLIMIMVD